MDYIAYNKKIWNFLSQKKNLLNIEPTEELLEKARSGKPEIYTAFESPIAQDWFPSSNWKDSSILLLGAGGGNVSPLLALAGANVHLVDFSKGQLDIDRALNKKLGQDVCYYEQDFQDLSSFSDNQFDLIIQPSSTFYIEDTERLWRETYRVLKEGGTYITTVVNPIYYMADLDTLKGSQVLIRPQGKTKPEISSTKFDGIQFAEFGHSLNSLIGEPLKTGFKLARFEESGWGKYDDIGIDKAFQSFITMKLIK